jgi:hypothetical protein
VGNDLVGDLDLTAQSIDGHKRAGKLLGFGETVQEIGNGGDLIGLFWDGELRQAR